MKPYNPPPIIMRKVVRHFEAPKISNMREHLAEELEKLSGKIVKGSSVAVAAGSRGIGQIDLIVKTTVDWIKARGGNPFIVPAMGSHGGATAEGQREVLASYGITEERMGAEIRSSMQTVTIAEGDPVPVYMDTHAYNADGVILINRIKPHTDFHAAYESGLVKMAVIGLGKHDQALAIHRYGVKGLKEFIPRCARSVFNLGKIIGGVAIVENQREEPAVVEVFPAEEIMKEEPRLLKTARELMPSLPAEDIDVLIVDRIGKDISGVGLDPNIIGRFYIQGEENALSPRIKTIYLRDLTEASHGNALGIGLADIISRRLYEKIDFPAMLENAYTSSFLERAKVPVIVEDDTSALDFALRACANPPEVAARILYIQDTLHLEEFFVSESMTEDFEGKKGLTISEERIPLFPDKQKNFTPFF